MNTYTNTTHSQKNGGFTIVEVIVTITLIAVFVGVFMQAMVYLSSSTNRQGREARAANIASANLAKYKNGDYLPDAYDCSIHTTKSGAYTALSNSSPNTENVPSGNWGSFTQEVILYAKRGCAGPTTIESMVSFGQTGSTQEIVKVGYAL